MSLTLTDMPGEIRNEIYGYCVVFEKPLLWRGDDSHLPNDDLLHRYLPHLSDKLVDLSILGVNKKIHAEARSVFYEQNCFFIYVSPILMGVTRRDFSIYKSFAEFILTIPAHVMEAIEHIRMQFRGMDWEEDCFESKPKAVGLIPEVLNLVRNNFKCLKTLTLPFMPDVLDMWTLMEYSSEKVEALLTHFDRDLRSIDTLQKINIEVLGKGAYLSSDEDVKSFERKIERLGWIILKGAPKPHGYKRREMLAYNELTNTFLRISNSSESEEGDSDGDGDDELDIGSSAIHI